MLKNIFEWMNQWVKNMKMLLFLCLWLENLHLVHNCNSLFRKRLKGDSSADYFVLPMLPFLPALICWKYFDTVSKQISRNEFFELSRNQGFLL